MSTKVGSLLIEVASGVARVESDMAKISKVINSNAEQWTKAFNLVKIAAGSWMAKELFKEGIQLMGQFAAAGLEGASKLKEHAEAASEFKQRQVELNTELQKFAGEIIGPMLPMANDVIISLRGVAEAAQWGAREMRDLLSQMPNIPSWTPLIGGMAEAWRRASADVSQYAAQVRGLERMRKERASQAEDPLLGMLPTEADMKESDDFQARMADVQKQRTAEQNRIKIEEKRMAHEEEVRQETEWARQGQERAMAQQAIDAQVSAVYNQNRADTRQGQLELLEEQYRSELALTNWNATQKLAIEKRYTAQVNAIQLARKDVALNTASTMFGALAQAAGVFFGQQSAAAKAFGILEVIVNTQRAVMQAWAAYPPPFGGYMAAAAYIQGAASIASILKAGSGGSSVGGAGATPANPSIQSSVPETMPVAAEPAEKMREAGKTTIIIQNMIGERTWVTNNLLPLLEDSQRDRGWNVEMQA